MVAVGAELAEQDVEPLALRDVDRGAHHVGEVEAVIAVACAAVAREVREQVLGEQDPLHLVAIVADRRKPRVARFDHRTDELLRRLIGLDHHHLRARDHDVADLHVADRESAFDHRQGVGAEHVAPFGVAQDPQQRVPVPGPVRLARQRPGEAPEPGPGGARSAVRGVVHGRVPAA